MSTGGIRIGELAARTGLSARALRYYEERGLLAAPRRSASGRRLYGEAEIVRLQQVISLRQLGLSLEEIVRCLSRADGAPVAIIERQLAQLRGQIVLQVRLCRRLERIAASLRAAETVSVEEFLRTIEESIMVERYYTPEQMAELEQRARALGDEHIRAVEAEWPQLIERVRAAMARGDDPASAEVQALARRWQELVQEFTGGNSEITRSLGRMWQQEPEIHGMDTAAMRELMAYIGKAMGTGQ